MGKPDLRFVAKDKNNGDRHEIAAAWPNQRGSGYFAKLGDKVREIVMEDGTVITGQGFFLDIYDEREKNAAGPREREDVKRGARGEFDGRRGAPPRGSAAPDRRAGAGDDWPSGDDWG